jgi:hypothetical protein
VEPYRDRDPNEYYPHLAGPSSQVPRQPPHPMGASGPYDTYSQSGYLPPGNPRARTVPANAMPSSVVPVPPMPHESRLPLPGTAPYPAIAPPIETPSFMGLVLFAAPLALATLAVAALALM